MIPHSHGSYKNRNWRTAGEDGGIDRKAVKRRLSHVKGLDSKLSITILNEIIDVGPNVLFDDVAGQQAAKQVWDPTRTRSLNILQPIYNELLDLNFRLLKLKRCVKHIFSIRRCMKL